MKKIFLFLLFLSIGIPQITQAQGWHTPAMDDVPGTNPNTFQGLNGVFFISATKGWAVGNRGTILTTSDGGRNWTSQTSGVTEDLLDVYFTSPTKGCAVGRLSTLLTTSDGGATWTGGSGGIIGNDIYGLYFLNATQGWAAGPQGLILVTNDGGSNWGVQNTMTGARYNSVYFANANQGWAVGTDYTVGSGMGIGKIVSTTNGGNNWTVQSPGTLNKLYGVHFVSATQGWAVGESGTILTTTNGGSTWTGQSAPTSNSLYSVFFISATQGWIAGQNGTILTTINGGATWTQQPTGVTNTYLNDVRFNTAGQGWAVGGGSTVLLYNCWSGGAALATGNASKTQNADTAAYYGSSGACNNLIARVAPDTTNGISGNTTAKVWVESSQPAAYVKRHYEITPAANASTATGTVTLYFTQSEFDDFNAVNTLKLPTGPTDAAGIANLKIEKRPGVSNNGSGLPATYSGASATIDPTDAKIVWNALQSRWEVTFDVTGFSGFFAKTQSAPLAIMEIAGQTGFSLTAQPNPAQDFLHIVTTGSSKGAITVTDLSGRLIETKAMSGSTLRLDVRDWPAGIYLLRYTDGQHSQTIKVVR